MLKNALTLVFSVLTLACFGQKNHTPSDTKATRKTKILYKNLQHLAATKVLFGHQDALAYGVNWKYEKGRSDVKDITGEHPAVYGWELGHLELDSLKSLDAVPFNQIKNYIKTAYKGGGLNTISWHFTNPTNNKSAWDTTKNCLPQMLPGGAKHQILVSYLDKFAAFASSLKDRYGRPIPIIFRPYHELTGSWFWWGQNQSTPEDFKTLWTFTVDYLRNTKKLHNLLYAYNTGDFKSKEHFLERYPGDDYVDIVSFDAYQHANLITDKGNNFINQVDAKLTMLNEVAVEKNKIPAFAETGYETIPQVDWWTKTLLPLLKNHQVSYVLIWRNAGLMSNGKMHYYAPYIGHPSTPDFVKFYNNDKMMFTKKADSYKLYNKHKN